MLGRLIEAADALAEVEHVVESNAGTYGATEAHRARGSGDPRYSNWRVYMTVGGRRRTEGDPDGAPGRALRHYDRHAADLRRLAAMRKQIDVIRSEIDRRHPSEDE